MGRVRSREHGVGAPEDPYPLLPRDPGGCDDADPAEHPYRTHHAANPRPPDGSGASGSTVDRGAVLRQVGRIDRARHHVDRAEHAEGVRDPQRDTRAGRRAHLGVPLEGPVPDLRRRRCPRVHPGGRLDLVRRVRLRPRDDRVQPHVVWWRRGVRRAADRSARAPELPRRTRRGSRFVADAGHGGPSRRCALVRRLCDAALRDPGRLQLPSHRRVGGPDLHRVRPGIRNRRRSVGPRGHGIAG